MARPSRGAIARAVLQRHPESPADELRIDVGRNTPGPLYQWLIAALLFSARIAANQAQSAAQALFEQGWRTPKRMAAVTWAERVKVLNRAGYARYDESTSRYIAETTDLLLERYGGDLRKLRDAAARDPKRERQLLKQFKGIGEVGADIFFREAQIAWDEIRRAVALLSLGAFAVKFHELIVAGWSPSRRRFVALHLESKHGFAVETRLDGGHVSPGPYRPPAGLARRFLTRLELALPLMTVAERSAAADEQPRRGDAAATGDLRGD